MSLKETIFIIAAIIVASWYVWMLVRRQPSQRLASVDAVVPAYNEAPCIENTLISLLNNKYIHHVICVNDGSTDDTAKVLERMRNSEKWRDRLHIIHQKNTGKGGALMHGISQASSDTVFLTDADTLIRNDDSLGYLLAEIEAGADAAGGICDVNLHKAGFLAHMRASLKAPMIVFKRGFQQLIGGSPFIISGGCGMFKTAIFQKHGFSDRTRVEDLDLTWTLVAHGYKVRLAPRCIVYPQECRHLRDEWRKWRRWIVGYAVCMRLHYRLLPTRFGLGSILPMFTLVIFGTLSYLTQWSNHLLQSSPHFIPLSLFPIAWVAVVFMLASIQSWRHKNAKLLLFAPLSVLHVLMTYAVWIVHGIKGFFTGREPVRDKPTRYTQQIVRKIRQKLRIQPPGILHIEIHHLAHGHGTILFAVDSATHWIAALHVPDYSQADCSAFFQNLLGSYPAKIKQIIACDSMEGQKLGQNKTVQQFCKLAHTEFVLMPTQRLHKTTVHMVNALQHVTDINQHLQTLVYFHNSQSPIKKMCAWYTHHPHIFIEKPTLPLSLPLETTHASSDQ